MSASLRSGPRGRTAEELTERIRAGGPALVALSGGVDSGLVASFAREALGPGAVAVTLSGASVPDREVLRAREVADLVGIEQLLVPADPLRREEYRANGADRCYHCRTVEAGVVRALAARRGTRQLLDGIHLDDLADDRPGIRAMDEAGFFHPLLWAGWDKADVRRAAKERGLPNWDRPSEACLASRVARGDPITAELLGRIDRAETLLYDHGFRRVRVRVRGDAARIEVDPSEVGRLQDGPLEREVAERLRDLGFRDVRVDPRGYRGPDSELPVVR